MIESRRGAEATCRRTLRASLTGLVLLLNLSCSGCTSTYMGRWVVWNRSDIRDHVRFPSHVMENAPPVYHFAEPSEPLDLEIAVERDGVRERMTLDELARSTETTALLVVRRDTLVYEGYSSGYTRDSVNTSFSVAKSITSLLVGIAIDEGFIGGLGDAVTEYLPELAGRDPRFARITLRHLLDMRSGIAFADHDLPWGDKPKAYYDPHLRERVLRKLEIAGPPGEEWVYNTYNPILLGLVLERATRQTVAAFMEAQLWQPLGMEFAGSWSVDGEDAPMEKMESGVNARAIDFAKLGRLVLRGGDWEGERIVSAAWIDASTTPTPGCELAAFRPREVCYRLAWWLTPAGDDRRPAAGATGHLGQYVYVFPEDEIVIVRFGREPGGVHWPTVSQTVARTVGPAQGSRISPVR